MASEVSPTRLYLGNLPRDVTKEDIYAHFKEAPGEITEVKLMNGFGFIEYKDAMDARDVVPTYHGSDLNGSRLTVQFARGSRPRGEGFPGPPDRTIHPRPRRTAHRMQITGLPGDTSWQDLKDFSRHPGVDVVYSEVGRERDGKGFVEFENASDLKLAVEKLDGTEFKGSTVSCIADPQDEVPRNGRYGRSRSPPSRRPYPSDPYYGRDPPPPRGYSPRPNYRRRTPPPHHHRYEDYGRYRSPPPMRGAGRGPPLEDYRDGYRGDPYAAPPRRPYEPDPYMANGYGRPRERTPPPYDQYGPSRSRYW